ncbi:MAG: hypothetical protein QOF16_257 [Actinomycetota bacterium]|nr:hypothetical protein [Actinomycetota bacterium]
MRSKVVGAALAAIVASTLFLPTPSSTATPHKRLRATKIRLQNVQASIHDDVSTAHGLKRHIDRLNHEINAAEIESNRLSSGIDRIRTDIHTAQAAVDSAVRAASKVKDIAKAQAVALYEQDSVDVLSVLLGSQSLSQLDTRAEMLGVAAAKDTGALIEYGRLRLTIEATHKRLFDKEAELSRRLDDQKKLQDELARRRDELASDLVKLHGKVSKDKDKEGNLLKQSRSIEAKILAHTTLHSVAILGKSAQGFIWPLNGAINSPFGPRWGSFHPGIDIDGYTGEPFVAAKPGVVIEAGWIDGYGNATIIDHGGGFETLYGHQSKLGVHAGERVRQGQIIGYVGCTGYCTGPHLHFEVRVNGTPQDPMKYLPPR